MQELTEQLRVMQTRLGHAELALAEASREAQARREEAAALRQVLDAAGATLAQVRAELAASEQAHEALERSLRAKLQSPRGQEIHNREAKAPGPKVGRHLGLTNRARDQVPAGGPKSVKWWAGT